MDRGIRPLNIALLTLLLTATISGVVAFGMGFPGHARWVVAVHGASGLGLLLLAPAKILVARRGLRRPGRSRKVISLTFTVLVLAGDREWAAAARGRRMAAHPGAAPDAAPCRCGGGGGRAAGCARGDTSPERPSPVAAPAAPHRPDATASATRHRRRRGLGGALGHRAGIATPRDRIARSRLRRHRESSRHAVDVRPGAPNRGLRLGASKPQTDRLT